MAYPVAVLRHGMFAVGIAALLSLTACTVFLATFLYIFIRDTLHHRANRKSHASDTVKVIPIHFGTAMALGNTSRKSSVVSIPQLDPSHTSSSKINLELRYMHNQFGALARMFSITRLND